MKTNSNSVILACGFFGIMLHGYSQGYIVPNGVTYAGFNGIGYGINVIHDPVNGTATGFVLNPIGKTPPTVYTNTFSMSVVLDIGVRVFLVSSNEPVSLQPILAGSYLELGQLPSFVFNSGMPFYVGLFTSNQNFYPPDGVYTDPLFGWARLVNNQGVIEMLDSALEYQGGGIFAGTQNIIPIPEPSGFGLVTLGAFMFGLRRRRES